MSHTDFDDLNPQSHSNEEVTAYYDQCHSIYNTEWTPDSHRANIHLGHYDEDNQTYGEAAEKMKRVLADRIDLSGDDRVLDCSAGLGDNATWIAQTAGAEAVGVNINRLQLGLARELAMERGVEELTEFRYDDFTELETVEDDSVDVVWAVESICYADDKGEFLDEARRVLRPGGRLVMTDWFLAKRSYSRLERTIMRKWLQGWKVPNYAHREEFREALRDRGFENVRVTDATEETLPSARILYLFSLWDYPVAKLLNAVGLREELRVDNTVAVHFMYYAYKLGLTTYDIVSAEV